MKSSSVSANFLALVALLLSATFTACEPALPKLPEKREFDSSEDGLVDQQLFNSERSSSSGEQLGADEGNRPLTADTKGPEGSPNQITEDAPKLSIIEVPAGAKPWISVDQLPWEAWYLRYMDGKRIGYSHLRLELASSNPDPQKVRVRFSRIDSFWGQSSGKLTQMEHRSESNECLDGTVLSFTTKVTANTMSQLDGDVVGENLTLQIEEGGGTYTDVRKLEWDEQTWGLQGLQAVLMQHVPKPGELLRAKVFSTELKETASAELKCGQADLTSLPGGKTELLLPVDVFLWYGDQGAQGRNWIDSKGEILKTITLSGPNYSTFRVPKDLALRAKQEMELYEIAERTVRLSNFPQRTPTERVVYSVSRNESSTLLNELADEFPRTPTQAVRAPTALTPEITVTAPQLDNPSKSSSEAMPASEYLQSSPLVPASHQLITKLASVILESEDASLHPAVQLTGGLHKRIQLVPFTPEFTDPLQAIRTQVGDCSEQAALLTALLRSQQIPARVVGGIIIDSDDRTKMRFHQWTEASIDHAWVGLDATTGSLAGVDRIKLLDSPLATENPYPAILPVFQAIEGLEVNVIASE